MWSEPRPAHVPGPDKRDWALVGALLVAALVEVAARPEFSFVGPSLAVVVGLLPTLLWRRSRPLAMASIGFGVTAGIAAARLATGHALPELHTTAFLLLLPYSLFRWGSGREGVVGAAVVLSLSALGLYSNQNRPDDIAGGLAVVVAAMAFGTAARHRARARWHELEQAKLLERERLARDLHDTVAHHVSAIAIHAQAGQAVAATHQGAAVDALRLIETEASRTLAEMRAIVRSLRRDEAAELAPGPHIEDLARRAGRPGELAQSPRIEDLEQLSGLPAELARSPRIEDLEWLANGPTELAPGPPIEGPEKLARRPTESAPGQRIGELEKLARRFTDGPAINVALSGKIDDLPHTISAAVYRVAQESITNARRHARNATRIEVAVVVDEEFVRLHVRDDGDPTQARPSAGYGLIGMSERAELVGGTCHAGPAPERGWTVTAVLPCKGRTS